MRSKLQQGGAPVYAYVFTHASSRLIQGTQHTMGAAHAAEIAYKFNNVRLRQNIFTGQSPAQGVGSSILGPPPNPDDIKAARAMSEFWSTFARTGEPSAAGQPEGPAYNNRSRPTMLIDTECKLANDPTRLEREAWARANARTGRTR